MNLRKQILFYFVIALLVLPGLAEAKREGRLIGKVMDPEGNPIEDVTVVSTCSEIYDYEESDVSDKRGMFTIDFPQLDITYTLQFSKKGYITFQSEQTWGLHGKARLEFTMYPGSDELQGGAPVSESSDAIYFYNLGVDAYNSGDYETAETNFMKALGNDAELHQAWEGITRIKYKQDELLKATEAAEKAIALGSTDQEIYRLRWEAYRALGNEEKADQALADFEAAGLRAEQAKEVFNDGVAKAKDGDNQGAYDLFQKAHELDPNLSEALLGIATTATEVGKPEEAVKAAEKLLRQDPDNESAIRIRYNAALALGDEQMIVDALVSLARVEHEIARDSLLSLAFKAYDANDMARAKVLFKKVLEVAPDQAQSHYLLALIFVNDGENEAAIGHLKSFLELAPDDPEAPTAQDLLDYLSKS